MSGTAEPLALKVDVDTLRGTLEGVPPLLERLRAAGAGATFLFSLGPDHTGRAIRRALRPGFFGKVSRTSVLSHYGLRTLLYGTLLPGPDIGRRGGHVMRAVREAGFEVGVHCFDHTTWQDFVTRRDPAWTRRQMGAAVERFESVFGCRPQVHGAAGWQMNAAAYELEVQFGFRYASDTRGSGPFVPALATGPSPCAQLPTTLPTLDELIGTDGLTEQNVHERLLELTRERRAGHVFTLHAELEGMKLRGVFERLLDGWQRQGYALVSLGRLFEAADRSAWPVRAAGTGTVAGRSGTLAVQL